MFQAIDAKKDAKKSTTVNKVKEKVQVVRPSTVTSAALRKPAIAVQATTAKQTEKSKENNTRKPITTKKKEPSEVNKVTAAAKKKELVEINQVTTVPLPVIALTKVDDNKQTTCLIKPVLRHSARLSEAATISSSEDSSLYVTALEELVIYL